MVYHQIKRGAWVALAVGLIALTGCRRQATPTGEVNPLPRSTPVVNRTLPSPVTPSPQPTATTPQPSAPPPSPEGDAPNPVRQSSYQPFTLAAYQRAKAVGQLDGASLTTQNRGADVFLTKLAGSFVRIREPKLYNLTDTRQDYGWHTLELIFDRPGVQAFAFTFG